MTFEEKYPHLTQQRIKELWNDHEAKFEPTSGNRAWWTGKQTVPSARGSKGLSVVKRVGVRTARKSKAK